LLVTVIVLMSVGLHDKSEQVVWQRNKGLYGSREAAYVPCAIW